MHTIPPYRSTYIRTERTMPIDHRVGSLKGPKATPMRPKQKAAPTSTGSYFKRPDRIAAYD